MSLESDFASNVNVMDSSRVVLQQIGKSFRAMLRSGSLRTSGFECLEDRRLLAAHPSVLAPALWNFLPRHSEAEYGPLLPTKQAAVTVAADHMLRDGDGRIGVRLQATDVDALVENLPAEHFEMTGAIADLHAIEGFTDASGLALLAELGDEGLLGVRPIFPPITNAGAALNEADFVLEADRTRTASSVDGSGVAIGILSDSYNNLGGESADIATGDLPGSTNPEGNNQPVVVLQDLPAGGSDEGRAMAQLIHDIAPGAKQGFATAFLGEIAFANNIRNLARNPSLAADIIVDDVGYFSAPFFQDGIVAQAVTEVVNLDDVAYFSSAGNFADSAFETTDVSFAFDSLGLASGNFLDFDPSPGVDTRQLLGPVSPDSTIRFSLQWNDPFFTTTGVQTDIDLFLVEAGTDNILAAGLVDNISSSEPIELVTYTNTSATSVTVDLMIQNFIGPNPDRIKYLDIDEIGADEFATNSPTIFGHAAAAEAISVAAVPWYDQDTPESFTSHGPTTILYSPDGTQLSQPTVRDTPRVASLDGVNTTFFGFDVDGDGFPNFFGTSAAAPNVAALSALLLEADPSLSSSQLYLRLETTAIDLETPGWDPITGFGLVNAFDAVVGAVQPIDDLPFNESFENGFLSRAWETSFTNGGRAQVSDSGGAAVGINALILASNNSFTGRALSQATLHFDLRRYAEVELTFSVRQNGEEVNPMPEVFTGTSESDGVAFSVDGQTWYRILSPTEPLPEVFTQFTFDLSALATNLGLSLSDDVRIRFQQYDNVAFPEDGILFDEIALTGELGKIAGRVVFYNRAPGAEFSSEGDATNAIDPSKLPLLPGQKSSFDNYTNYIRGLNGLIVDIANPGVGISESDFEFAAWDGISPDGFQPIDMDLSVSANPLEGRDDVTRLRIDIPNNTVRNTWLRVTVLANERTNLRERDVFYFGNAIGDFNVGNPGDTVRVNAIDVALVRSNQSILPNSVDVDNIYDINKDGRVNAIDDSLTRGNQAIIQLIRNFTAPEE